MFEKLKTFAAASLRSAGRHTAQQAIDAWQRRQTELKTEFLRLAGATGKPRGLRWSRCDWPGTICFARERSSGMLTAFVGLVVRFEAIEGGEMEDVPAATLPRDATAVFHFHRGRWETAGRTLFNMTPDEALSRMSDQFEPVTPIDADRPS